MRLRVDHETRYTYDAPVSYGLQQVRMRPKDSRGQKVLDWTITVEGGATELCYDDHNGNRVDLIGIEPGRTETSIRCVGLVENTEGDGVLGKHQGFLPLWHFKRSSPLTRAGEGVRKLVAGLGDCDIAQVSTGHALSAAILDTVGYEGGNTHSGTTAEEAITGGTGVCQDHAHIFCSAARLMGLPARYVSGYLMMNDRVEQDASHAWAEAFFEGLGWVGFDISNGYSPDERYIRVATGIDFREAAPINGMRMGGSDEGVLVTLKVEQ
ncbi:transglutaminase [Citromicrobium sp. RCC1885]|uniref:transglutaminase family protein n=1 Tax=unclassified Citromicrobium TaxID=2630544 RepID=UPI0006C92B52|nr:MULTISPECIES: transglutaminase family protein [unclassified Citromicrobium]KPM22561.1 transglutaminase [Citromicrobium sp. RCC1885]KPM26044.1 transglutaminase [Citromicrobium sp. RCC1878]MAO03723.1 transglutaminase family protein [Citromicrobium sp.]OAM07869.1 transglutaminase [Citromicrobium sp. RCC1897]|tara:strand:+ start:3162 stop:3962 length:801 start_codon:yes stop_codon:yes gene_type:complete